MRINLFKQLEKSCLGHDKLFIIHKPVRLNQNRGGSICIYLLHIRQLCRDAAPAELQEFNFQFRLDTANQGGLLIC